jgi:O-Antigen ligase
MSLLGSPDAPAPLARPGILAGLQAAGLASMTGPLTALGAAAVVAPLAAGQGGYFPTAWGWAAVPFAWTAGLALLVRRRIRLQPLELVFLGALGLLTAWVGLSLLWSRDFPQTVLELERTLVYLSGTLAAALVLRRRAVPWLVAGLAAAVAGICAYALATRLFPSVTGPLAIAVNRLQTPIGYWNALGIFAAMGTLLLVGLAARAKWAPGRALAAAGTVVCLTTLYFTFSRGSWLALFVGVVVALAVDPRRVQLSVSLLVLAPFSAAAVAIASRSSALVDLNRPLSQTTADGHRVALAVLLLAAGAAGAALVQHVLAVRWRPDRTVRTAYVAAIAVAVAAAAGVTLAHYGGPVSAARRAWHSFRGAPVQVEAGQSLNSRLFSFSNNGRVDLWTAAWHDAAAHPVLGSGAGSFEQYWYAHRTESQTVRDAHSLYMETLAELGVVGFVLLVALLAVPLVALVRVRERRFAPLLGAAYVAFLVHAAVDWDWEIPAVVLLALLAGVGLLALGRDRASRPVSLVPRIALAVAVLVPLAGFSVYTLVGNRRLADAANSLGRGDWKQAAARARDATSWMPWSAGPWHALAAADAALGRRTQAVADMREAVKRSPRDWTLWIDLGNVSTGAERRNAYARARALNPREAGIPKV